MRVKGLNMGGIENEISHAHIIMWTVGFFITGLGLYGGVSWLVIKRALKTTDKDLVALKQCVNSLEIKKVEVSLYVKDREEVKEFLGTLQTTAMCAATQRACAGAIHPVLNAIKENLEQVLENQASMIKDRAITDGKLDMVITRQNHVIQQIDSHLNGHVPKLK